MNALIIHGMSPNNHKIDDMMDNMIYKYDKNCVNHVIYNVLNLLVAQLLFLSGSNSQ